MEHKINLYLKKKIRKRLSHHICNLMFYLNGKEFTQSRLHFDLDKVEINFYMLWLPMKGGIVADMHCGLIVAIYYCCHGYYDIKI